MEDNTRPPASKIFNQQKFILELVPDERSFDKLIKVFKADTKELVISMTTEQAFDLCYFFSTESKLHLSQSALIKLTDEELETLDKLLLSCIKR